MDVWNQIGGISPRELVGARLETHHAVQLVSIAVGRALVPSRDDDSHTALSWLDVPQQWVGEMIPETGGVRAGLRPADLVLTVGGKDDPAGQQLELAGRGRDAALEWLRAQLAAHGVDPARVVLDFHYEMPPHPIENGEPWSVELASGRAELAAYFAGAAGLLAEVALENDASPILTWPHHFDVGTVLVHSADGQQSIGVGLSPGDGYYPEPYFYVSPYPRAKSEPPSLPSGHWHDEERFFGAVLTATELLASGEAESTSREFLTAAVAASRHLHDRA